MSLNNIPPSWESQALSEVALVVQGQSPPGSTYNTRGTGLPFFQGKAEFGPMTPTAVKWCTEPSKVAEPEDVLISVRAPVGPTNLANVKCCIGRGLAAIRPYDLISPRFLLYYLRHSVSLLARQATGTTFKAISGKQLRGHPTALPPLGEQRRIVEAIESYFTRLDDAVATLERVQRNLKRYRAAVLKAAVEGRLVPTEAELARAEGRDYEPASVLLERILVERRRRWEEAELAKMTAKGKTPKDDRWKAKYVEPVAPDTSELPELPEGWCWATLDTACESVTDGDHLPPPQSGDGVPFLVIGNVAKGRIDFEDTRFVPEDYFNSIDQKRRPRPGDILYTVTGSFGIPVLVETNRPFCVQRHIAIVRTANGINQRYLAHALASGHVFQQASKGATGTAQKTVALKVLRGIAVPVPSVAEQRRIADEVEGLLSMERATDATVSDNRHRCIRLRQSILKWAFEGRLVDQDPSDESASVLLERIRAERAEGSRSGPVNRGGRRGTGRPRRT